MTQFLSCHKKVYQLWYFGNLARSLFESYLVLMRVENQNATINNKVRVIRQICVLDFVK